MNLYRPPDVERAHDVHGATCGHAALAAIAGHPVCVVCESARQTFSRGNYVSSVMMESALSVVKPREWRTMSWRASQERFPVHGLVLLQFIGPWMAPGVPFGARLARTHWIATAGDQVYDINQDGWALRSQWETDIVPKLLTSFKRSTGWSVKSAYEVQPHILSRPPAHDND